MAYWGNEPAKVAVKVGANVITTTEIQDGQVYTADILDDAITAQKVDDDGTGFRMGSLGLGGSVSGSEKLTVTGTSSFSGAITGNLTGNASGTAATVTGAAQSAITSVGTLTSLTSSGTISSSTGSTTDSVLTLSDAGVADYKFTFPDTSTIRLSTSTSSTKVFDLSNAGSGKMKLSVDGGLRPITGSDYSLVLESTNELNFYNADGYADSNRATLHINYSGTGSTVDLSNSELVVEKGTGSTFGGTLYIPEYITHDGDTNTHFRMRADEIILTTNGNNCINIGSTEVAINHDQQNIDFRVESDTNDYALFVDAGASCVGINTNNTDHPLCIKLDAEVAFNQGTDLNGETAIWLNGADDDGEATMIRWANHGSMNNYFGCVQVGASSQADFVWTAYNGSNYAEKLRVRASGAIIAKQLTQTGSTNSRYPLYWVHSGTDGSIEPYTGSVRAMKKDIADMGSVDWIHSLKPRSFKFRDFEDVDEVRTYKNTTEDNPNTEYGLIAEEVDEVEGSDYIVDKDSDGEVKGVLYHNLVPILLKALQEQNERIKALENA